MYATNLKCTVCGAKHQTSDKILVCTKCGKLLDVEFDLEEIRRSFSKESLKERVRSLWRYRELLPIDKDDCIVSLGEGVTSLRKIPRYGGLVGYDNLFVKVDYLNPTGSFKDRGTTVNVSKLKELGVTSVMDDSSGNAGLSLAAYCASAGMECILFVPGSAPSEKLVQAQLYGAKIRTVPGSRSDAAKAAEDTWKDSSIFYASHNLGPFFLEGMKTFACELAEDLNWQVPDHIIFPVGGGSLLRGTWKGFDQLMKLGMINRVPSLHCVQSEACMPIVTAFEKGKSETEPAAEGETIAGGIRISNPARGAQVLDTLRRTGGKAVAVSDDAVMKHQRLLASKEGMFAEPTTCAALAGLDKLREMNAVEKGESVIVALTGFGLKDMKSAAAALA
ncbi:MAG: threonine synthase [archaeon]